MLPDASALEKSHKRAHVILVSGYGRYVDSASAHRLSHLLLPVIPPFAQGLPCTLRRGVEPAFASGFEIFDADKPYVGDLGIAFVENLYAYDIMLVGRNGI